MEEKSYTEMLNRFAELGQIAFDDPSVKDHILWSNVLDLNEDIPEEHMVLFNEFGIVKRLEDNNFEGYIPFMLNENDDYKEISKPIELDLASAVVFSLSFFNELIKKINIVNRRQAIETFDNVIIFPLNRKR